MRTVAYTHSVLKLKHILFSVRYAHKNRIVCGCLGCRIFQHVVNGFEIFLYAKQDSGMSVERDSVGRDTVGLEEPATIASFGAQQF